MEDKSLKDAIEEDFKKLGFEPKGACFEFKTNGIIITIDEQREVSAYVEIEKEPINLIADTIGELEDWLEFIELNNTNKSKGMDYNKLSKEIHEAQKEAGWYDNYRSDKTLLLLIKSELFEAFEAYRKGEAYIPLDSYYLETLLGIGVEGHFASEFKATIKDSFADELADIMIRVLDFAGYKGIEIIMKYGETKIYYPDVLDDIVNMDKYLTALYDRFVSEDDIFNLICKVKDMASKYEIDLERHILLKLAYNKTRGKRHGNKVL
ncbi:nucleoside triphosphate pyrophosphohydrolase family protein [Aureispira anguillae]|uniref:Uncharacterized protein n=1 Tax=Aureispira anguillae TaxID=2864201 RepID=A0A916DV23_9BACT|nr:hypothetical protein [Aureispira anguillae]BDS13075.1 hypothetical protein AsAng_0038030 [Aureispira anguillae]